MTSLSKTLAEAKVLYANGVAGLHDYGIIGKKIQNHVLQMWRDYFCVDDIETPHLLLEEVLKRSGHLDRFNDYVVYDYEGNSHRADHLAVSEDYRNERELSQVLREEKTLGDNQTTEFTPII